LSDDDEMTPEKTYAGFVGAAMEFLTAQGPQAAVLILVEGSRGIQTFRNQNSLPWVIGICECGKEMFKELGKKLANQEQLDRVAEEEEKRIQDSVARTKGKAN